MLDRITKMEEKMESNDIQKITYEQKRLESAVRQIANNTGDLLEPFKRLKAEQRVAIAILGVLVQGISYLKRPALKIDDNIVQQFKSELDQIQPYLGSVVVAQDPCFESSVAYAAAVSKCEDEGRSEEECFEALGAQALSVQCMEERIASMKADIEDLLKSQEPPKPIPWQDDLL
jgi:uncharacterized small protein (DUF1192 family)